MRKSLVLFSLLICAIVCISSVAADNPAQTREGYYRHPAIYNETIVFVAEGDLWKVGTEGGVARRLTTHPGLESHPAISPDGKLLAFTGQYEGPTDVYVMPLEGGLPQRLTYFGRRASVEGWTPSGEIICATYHYSTLPDRQLIKIDPKTGIHTDILLRQAADGSYTEDGETLYFTRFPFQGSYTKRYKGGTAQNIWKFTEGEPEAVPLTSDYSGTSCSPTWYDGRVYFVSDRDGTMNLWSMDELGGDMRQLTRHTGWDAKDPSLSNGRIVYQLGADLHLFSIAEGIEKRLPVLLESDFDQLREDWIDKPSDYITASHLSPDGDRVVITARGDLFVVPSEGGRMIKITDESSVRYLYGRFLPDGKSLVALSDATGELEFYKFPVTDLASPRQLTDNGTVFRSGAIPSPDGRYLAFDDLDQKLWIYDMERDRTTLVDSSITWDFSGLTWSPDSRWLAYVKPELNFLGRIYIYDTKNQQSIPVTSDRYIDKDPAFSPDGKWLYFLSDRDVSTVLSNVWDLNQPFPMIDKMTRLYLLPLTPGLLSPFEPENELTREIDKKEKSDTVDSSVVVEIDFENIIERVIQAPVPDGNYGGLEANNKQLYWLSWEAGARGKRDLQTIELKNKDAEVKTLADDIQSFELSRDGKKMLIRRSRDLFVVDAVGTSNLDLSKSKVNLSDWSLSVNPATEWRQMFIDAWRMERDYFYDPNMHGVDWEAVRDKYLPLVSRITDRFELSDLLGEMVGELSALHIYVFGGDTREGPDDVPASFLGARMSRDDNAGGYRVDYIYQTDPDEPEHVSPLARPGVDVSVGDIIKKVNGVPTLSVTSLNALLKKSAGKEVMLSVSSPHSQTERKVIVKPVSVMTARDLRYRDWEYSRRLEVDRLSDGEIGYVHLRATSSEDYGQWLRDFRPVIDRKGLIIDMRHNNGGQIDSWILTSLLRRPWAYWQSRVGVPYPNMQISFNGHIVVICDEWTASDGELFCEGIRRLGLGKVIGTRTWGGEIWLSYGNLLVDKGIASAAQSGVFGPEGEWIIEGHGFVPDIIVDNLPHATFKGEDAQLEAAIEYLKGQIEENPPAEPIVPAYPDKSFKP